LLEHQTAEDILALVTAMREHADGTGAVDAAGNELTDFDDIPLRRRYAFPGPGITPQKSRNPNSNTILPISSGGTAVIISAEGFISSPNGTPGATRRTPRSGKYLSARHDVAMSLPLVE
jgi:hypothetical protein